MRARILAVLVIVNILLAAAPVVLPPLEARRDPAYPICVTNDGERTCCLTCCQIFCGCDGNCKDIPES